MTEIPKYNPIMALKIATKSTVLTSNSKNIGKKSAGNTP